MSRKRPPDRRSVVRQKVQIKTDGGTRTVYLDVHDDEKPLEIWIRAKGRGMDDEKHALYSCLAIAYSLALQHGAPLEIVGKQLLGVRGMPSGPVVGDERIKSCTSQVDYIGRALLIHHCGQDDLAHAPKADKKPEPL